MLDAGAVVEDFADTAAVLAQLDLVISVARDGGRDLSAARVNRAEGLALSDLAAKVDEDE